MILVTLLIILTVFWCISWSINQSYRDVPIKETPGEYKLRRAYYTLYWLYFYDDHRHTNLLADDERLLDLKTAIIAGNHDLVEQHFIAANFSLEERKEDDGDIICALARMAIIQNGNLHIANLIVKISFDIESQHWQASYEGPKPKHWPWCVEFLIKDFIYAHNIFIKLEASDTDIYFNERTGDRFFHDAAKAENWFIVDVLAMRLMKDGRWKLKNYSDKYNLTIFHILSAGTYAAPVEKFLKLGIVKDNINQRVSKNSPFRAEFTPMHFAYERCRMTVIKVLSEYGAVANVPTQHLPRADEPLWCPD